jgi:hypothetical protein
MGCKKSVEGKTLCRALRLLSRAILAAAVTKVAEAADTLLDGRPFLLSLTV